MDDRIEEILKKCCCITDIQKLSDKEKMLLINQADKNVRLQSNNDFLGSTDEIKFFTFNLPRIVSCPGRTAICSSGCYQAISEEMLKGKDRESQVVYSRRLNWFLAEQDDFVERMVKEIIRKRPKEKQKLIIRIHASGDFYSEEYLEKWMKIALITKLLGKKYEFVAYTKSYSELDNVLGNQAKLKKMYKEAHDFVKVSPIEKSLSLHDFNLNIIASYMDDTDENAKAISEKWMLPIYFVTRETDCELKDCEEKSCAECLDCYKFPMKTVTTRLR